MKNIELANKIKQLRTQKGLSQEELATNCGLSLRTVQRIEKGETEPRGDTLKKLALALGVHADELIDWPEQEDRRFLALLNLSALSYIAFPILGIIVPLAIWMLKKDQIKLLNETGKRLLNFQITWSILLFCTYLVPIVGFIGPFGSSNIWNIPLFLIAAMMILYLFNGILIAFNTVRSLRNKQVIYHPAIPFLR